MIERSQGPSLEDHPPGVGAREDPPPDSLEFVYAHVNRAAAVAGHPVPAALDKPKAARWNDI
jgi:hypothetical protein